MRILFLGAATLLVLAIAARLVAALLILPIALRISLLMLLPVVLMLVVAALTRILLLRVMLVRLVGVVRTLFVTHHLHSLQAERPEAPEVSPEGEVEGLHALYKEATPTN
jgi:hypothetical protein